MTSDATPTETEFFSEEDGQGRALVVYGRDDGKAVLQVLEREGGGMTILGSWLADPAIAPDLHRAICEAAGTLPPVMLGRPDLDSAQGGDGWISFRGLRLRRSLDGGVSFALGGNIETLPGAQARQAAAVAVALADEAEPPAEEVDELTAVIVQGDPSAKFGPARVLARKILLARYRREAAGA